jgi:hypothetical protein
MLRTSAAFLLSRYFHCSQLDAPTAAGAIPLVPYDSRGLCGGVLEEIAQLLSRAQLV